MRRRLASMSLRACPRRWSPPCSRSPARRRRRRPPGPVAEGADAGGRARSRGAVGDRLFALGSGVAGKAVARNEEYDPATDRWRERAPPPQPRDDLGVAVLGGKIHTFGGFTASVHQGRRPGVPIRSGRRQLATLRPCRRRAQRSASPARRQSTSQRRGLDAVTVTRHEVYDPQRRWSAAAPLRRARDRMAVVAVNGKSRHRRPLAAPPIGPDSTMSMIRRRIAGLGGAAATPRRGLRPRSTRD